MSSELLPDEVVRFDDVGKRYRLGGGTWTGDLRDDASRLFRRLFGRETAPPPTVDALERVSFRVRRGENLAFIGANGAGKSTALKLVARITVPTSGLVQVRGRVASLIQIGAGFHRELTGKENVYLYGAILGLSRAEIRARYGAIVEFAGLERFMDTPVKRYSDGMHVRLGFSVAVHAEADILLVDEVLAVGDREFRQRSFDRMREFVESETTLLFVSHQRDLVENACERAILLEGGRLVTDGPVAETWQAYVERGQWTAAPRERAPGSPPPAIEILDVELVGADGRTVSAATDGEPLEIRISYLANQGVEGAAISVTLRRGATRVFHASSAEASALHPLPSGAHAVAELQLASVPLLPAEYALEIEAHAAATGRAARADRRVLPLLVKGSVGLGHGIVSLQPRWTMRRGGP